MDILEITITGGQAEQNKGPLTNFEILSFRSNSSLITFKINQNEKIIYLKYFPKSYFEKFVFMEIINDIGLWTFNWEIEYLGNYGNNLQSFQVLLKINVDQLLVNEYLNKSIALNCLISSEYDNMTIFDTPDFLNKSFISFEEPFEPPKKFKIKLYDYQKKSLNKMIKIEKGNINFKVKYTVPINVYGNEISYDPINNKKVEDDKYLDIVTNGGVLADEMGLGKTITSIALVVCNPPPNDYPAVKYSEDYEMNKLFAKATLVLCPSHLTKQWETEVTKCCPTLKVITIVTKKDMDKLTVTDVINADIIITSHQFLMNFKYYPSLHYKICTITNYCASDRRDKLKAILSELLKDEEQLLALETPVFEFFYFQRIILDEGHEIFGEMIGTNSLSRYMANWVSSMDANYYWYVSGTPFVNYRGVMNCSRYINLKLEEKEKQLGFDYSKRSSSNYHYSDFFAFLKKEYIWSNIISKICIRHTKKDVEEQIKIPGYEEKLIWVKLTNLERQLYDSKKGKVPNSYLQQLCCHPMVLENSKKIFGDIEVDLSLMQDKLLEYHTKNYELYKNKLGILDSTRQEYHMLKKTYENSMNESHYMINILKQMIENKIEEEENCSICLDKIENPTLTACGHLYCYECLKMCLSDKNKCPMCKKDLSGKEIMVKNKKIDNDNVNPLIQKYGSKLGKAISIIRTLVALPNSRIIIFSQWDDMLILVGRTLSENGIENSFVKGNVWSRNKAISKFKAGKNSEGENNKVIMLSLKNSASGTNLTEATHILFIEPINAPNEECRAIEGQAIGRACRVGQKNKVNVMRILIENSIEEDIYRKSYNKDVVVDVTNDDNLITQLISNKSKEIEL